jgi:hypothetical protein
VKRVLVQRVVAVVVHRVAPVAALVMRAWKLRLILIDSVAQASEPIAIDIVEQAWDVKVPSIQSVEAVGQIVKVWSDVAGRAWMVFVGPDYSCSYISWQGNELRPYIYTL